MSGPKTDHFELERQRRAALERERQEKLRKIREETERLNREKSKIVRHIEMMNKNSYLNINISDDTLGIWSTIEKFRGLNNSCQKQLEQLVSQYIPSEPDQIAMYTSNLISQSDRIISDYNTKSRGLQEQILRYVTDNVKKQIEKLSAHLSEELHTIGDAREMQSTINAFRELNKTYQNRLENLLRQTTPIDPNQKADYAKILHNQSNSIISEYHVQSQKLQDQILRYLSDVESLEKLKAINFSGEVKRVENIVDFDFSIILSDINNSEKIEVDVKERAKNALVEIQNFINSDCIQASDLKILTTIANNIYTTAFQTRAGFASAEAEYKTIKPSVTKNQEIFDMLYQDYYAEYIIYLDILNRSRATPHPILPKEKYEFLSIEQLQEEKEVITQQSILENEKNFIRTQIDEVMKECGYNVTKEIVFNENEKANHFICSDASQSSGIHIRVSDDKQIMMEIVALELDRGADEAELNIGTQYTGEQVDPATGSYLVSQMDMFCDLHPKIVEDLQKRGVFFKMKAHLATNAKYRKKIYISNKPGRRNLHSGKQRQKAQVLKTMTVQ